MANRLLPPSEPDQHHSNTAVRIPKRGETHAPARSRAAEVLRVKGRRVAANPAVK